jgi:hypothetical protein
MSGHAIGFRTVPGRGLLPTFSPIRIGRPLSWRCSGGPIRSLRWHPFWDKLQTQRVLTTYTQP